MDQLLYFLSHDDDVARELEALSPGETHDLLGALDFDDPLEEIEELEAYAEIYTANGPLA
jgi:hypothetical protein